MTERCCHSPWHVQLLVLLLMTLLLLLMRKLTPCMPLP
jgi:hypothetical protein